MQWAPVSEGGLSTTEPPAADVVEDCSVDAGHALRYLLLVHLPPQVEELGADLLEHISRGLNGS
jgi:hypothetical protein